MAIESGATGFLPALSFPCSLASRPLDFLSPMEVWIESLVKLQAIELDRARRQQEIRALPAEIARAETALTAAERQSADASAALSREETLRTRLEREIDAHRQKAARFRTQLDAVTTTEQAAAIEHEMQFASSEAERLENEEYASLERTEAQEAALAQSRALVEKLAAELELARQSVAARKQELTAELAALDASRAEVRAAIDPDFVTRFDRIAALRGTAVARAENQQCTGCRMGIRPQTWNELRDGKLLTCDSCSRLLYWDPALAPAPQEPRPDLVPGAGRAPRKQRPATE